MTDTQTPVGVREIASNGVAVALQGTRGRGREVLLDRDVWDDVSARFGTSWVLDRREAGHGLSPIRVLQGDPATGKPCADPVILAHYVAGVGHREIAYHRDRDALNLRRHNLDRIDFGQWLGRNMPMPRVPMRKAAPNG